MGSPTTTRAANVRRLLRGLVQAAVLAAVAVLMALRLRTDWGVLQAYAWTLRAGYLVPASVTLVLAYLFVVLIWQRILVRIGAPISFRAAYLIWFRTSLMRYLPGRIWNILGAVYLCEREGVPRGKALASGFINQVFSVSSAALFGAAYMIGSPQGTGPAWKALFYLLPLTIVFCHPAVLRLLVRLLSRRKGMDPESAVTIRLRDALALYAAYIVAWGIFGLSFHFFTLAFAPFPLARAHLTVSVYVVSYILGFLSMLTPGGMGVREGILTYLLGFYFPMAVSIVIAVASRVFMVAVDVACFASTYLLPRGKAR